MRLMGAFLFWHTIRHAIIKSGWMLPVGYMSYPEAVSYTPPSPSTFPIGGTPPSTAAPLTAIANNTGIALTLTNAVLDDPSLLDPAPAKSIGAFP